MLGGLHERVSALNMDTDLSVPRRRTFSLRCNSVPTSLNAKLSNPSPKVGSLFFVSVKKGLKVHCMLLGTGLSHAKVCFSACAGDVWKALVLFRIYLKKKKLRMSST